MKILHHFFSESSDGYRLISSFSCSRETAEFEFRSSLSKTPRKDGNLTELKAKFCEKSNEADNIRSELNAVGRELKELKEIRHYLLQYKENAPYRQRYNNAKDKEAYAMKHDEQLTLFDGARNKHKQLGIKPNISELKQVKKDLSELERRDSDLEKEYDSARKETRDLEQKYRNGIWEIRILTQPF